MIEQFQQGLRLNGSLNYYRASPLRPPRPEDPAAAAVTLAPEMLTVGLPTLVIWGMDNTALPPNLIEGLEPYVPQLTPRTRTVNTPAASRAGGS